MKRGSEALAIVVWLVLTACTPVSSGGQAAQASVRADLERRYAENAAAFMKGDIQAIMALRAPDFHTVTPDGVTQDRAAMEVYTQGLLNGIKKWNKITLTIDSLEMVGDKAIVIMSQHLDRMALRPDNQVHHVETWATQRETWVRSGSQWLLWRVDLVRNQRRLVDGKPG
jgi:ketosteroid isomerase-like protein